MKSRFGWEHYDKPVYFSLPNDGAQFRCAECEQMFDHDEVILCQGPNDERQVLCKESCVCEKWLESATDMGAA